MFKFINKHRLVFDVLYLFVCAVVSVMHFIIDDEPAKKKWNIFLGVIFGLMAVFKLVDVIEGLRKRKVE